MESEGRSHIYLDLGCGGIFIVYGGLFMILIFVGRIFTGVGFV